MTQPSPIIPRSLTPRESELIRLLWDYLRKDPKNRDRRQTAWGTKTQIGLVNTIAYILDQTKEK